jgi:dihydrofolate synthase/folylpolyglutamate synthase
LLDQRWPETKIEPSLTRITALMDLLGSPQRGYPSIHIAGTNGKTSVARMVDALLTALQRRTGRTTSPHLQSAVERIAIDGHPISPAQYVATYSEIEPFVQMVDQQSQDGGGPAMSKFEVLTAMAFAAFADAPIDVAVIEVGLGGRWRSSPRSASTTSNTSAATSPGSPARRPASSPGPTRVHPTPWR